jgi:hypothetical protein
MLAITALWGSFKLTTIVARGDFLGDARGSEAALFECGPVGCDHVNWVTSARATIGKQRQAAVKTAATGCVSISFWCVAPGTVGQLLPGRLPANQAWQSLALVWYAMPASSGRACLIGL